MKKHLFLILLAVVALTGCRGRQKASSTGIIQAEQTVVEEPASDARAEVVKRTVDRKIPQRRVFYPVFENRKEGGYYVSKEPSFFMIHEDGILFDELDMENFTFKISDIDYKGEDEIVIELNSASWMYYHHYAWLREEDEQMGWRDLSMDWYGDRVRLVRDPETFIWTILLGDKQRHHDWEVIESYDIIPSGYRYTNMDTRRHDPRNEKFDRRPEPMPEGVIGSDVPFVTVSADEDLYASSNRPFEGRWLLLEHSDLGPTVYKYWDETGDGRGYIPTTMEVRENAYYYTSYREHYDAPFGSVRYYDDGTMLLDSKDMDLMTFRWENEEKGLARWSHYYDDGRIVSHDLYVREDMNEYPVVDYEAGELFIN